NSGTLKALGYDNQDIMKKFIFYGLVSGLSGAIIGIILGHTLMPIIVYNAYRSGFTVPKIEFHFHLGVTLVALLRSEEHTSELQSRFDLVCRLLLEKKKELIIV